jgi:hypothetical protein
MFADQGFQSEKVISPGKRSLHPVGEPSFPRVRGKCKFRHKFKIKKNLLMDYRFVPYPEKKRSFLFRTNTIIISGKRKVF